MKKRSGDRKDGSLLRDIDSMHFICPILYPNRCDNEAFISEKIDLTETKRYIDKLNAENPDFHYSVFQIVVAACVKAIHLRPKMNRFIVNGNTYQRNEVSASFVVKKLFSDNGGEALAFIHTTPDFTLTDIHNEIYKQQTAGRSDNVDKSTESMNIFNKMPRFISKSLVHFIMWLDKHGWVPQFLIDTDPYYSSVVLTNLGSIKLHSGYHHLTNWGTNSVFVALGEHKLRPFFNDDGSYEMKDSIDIGLTIDERIADGYYYSKTVALLKKLIENPQLLELPFSEKVDG